MVGTQNEVSIRAIVDGEIGEDDKDSIDCLQTEMIASLAESLDVSMEVVRIDSPQPIIEYLLAVCVYQRRE